MILFRYCPLGYKRWCLIEFLRISAFFSCTVRENQVETWWHGFFSKPEITNCDLKRFGSFPPPSGGRGVPPSSSPPYPNVTSRNAISVLSIVSRWPAGSFFPPFHRGKSFPACWRILQSPAKQKVWAEHCQGATHRFYDPPAWRTCRLVLTNPKFSFSQQFCHLFRRYMVL
jgi:hypothetical protein